MLGWMKHKAKIKIARRNINNLRYADDTILMAESEEELMEEVPFCPPLYWLLVQRAASSFQVMWGSPAQALPCAPWDAGGHRQSLAGIWEARVFGCGLSHSTSPYPGDREELLSLSG